MREFVLTIIGCCGAFVVNYTGQTTWGSYHFHRERYYKDGFNVLIRKRAECSLITRTIF